jgi:hypothetical protein
LLELARAIGDKPGALCCPIGLRVKSNPSELAKRKTKVLRHMLAFELIPEP